MSIKLPELLLPAGDLEKAYFAFKYGADAIYCGVPMFALRTRMNVFREQDIEEIIGYAHSIGKKVYITLNGFPHQNMIKPLRKHLEFLAKINPDGLIIADTGVLYEANKICPNIPKHLSVQASTVSESGMRFWHQSGVKRIILAREISIKEVKEIHKLFPEMELEYFVHGAVCMAYSGRCLLSNFMAHRDANRGMCAHSCRWKYRVFEREKEKGKRRKEKKVCYCEEGMKGATKQSSRLNLEEQGKKECDEKIVQKGNNGNSQKLRFNLQDGTNNEEHGTSQNELTDNHKLQTSNLFQSIDGDIYNIRDFEETQIWEEELRPGEFIPVEQDFHGTHIMSSRDMCMIEHLKEIMDAGICSLKVEGRNKTIYYLSSVGRAYRQALDDIKSGKEFDKNLWNEIHATANRGFFAGFLHGKPSVEGQQYEENRSTADFEFCGRILKFFEKGEVLLEDFEGFKKGYKFSENTILIDVKNRVDKGNEIIFVYPKIKDDKKFKSKNFWKDGELVDAIHGGDGNAWIGIGNLQIDEGTLLRQKVKNNGIKK